MCVCGVDLKKLSSLIMYRRSHHVFIRRLSDSLVILKREQGHAVTDPAELQKHRASQSVQTDAVISVTPACVMSIGRSVVAVFILQLFGHKLQHHLLMFLQD